MSELKRSEEDKKEWEKCLAAPECISSDESDQCGIQLLIQGVVMLYNLNCYNFYHMYHYHVELVSSLLQPYTTLFFV